MLKSIILLSVFFTISLKADTVKQQIDTYTDLFRQSHKIPSVIVGVIRPNPDQPGALLKEIFTSGKPVNSSTVFRIGSITKLMTASLLAHYIEKRELKFDDTAQKYLPIDVHVPVFNTHQINLLDLATHTSGLPLMPSNFHNRKTYTLNNLYDFINRVRLLSAPGRKYVYSNVGYALLADILTRYSRQTWENLASQILFQKLNMLDTRSQLTDSQVNRLVPGHHKNGKQENSLNLESANSPFIGSDGLFSTMDDMLAWLTYSMGKGATDLNFLLPIVMQPRRIINITTQSEICLGWEFSFLDRSRKFRKYSKTGRLGGYSAYVAFVNDSSTGVVVLANADTDIEEAGNRILQLLNQN